MKFAAGVGATVAIVLLAFVAGSYRAGAATQAGPRVVCGAWFKALPTGWHQSRLVVTQVVGGVVPSGTGSWAATPRSVSGAGLGPPLPRDAIVITVGLNRPKAGPTGRARELRLPLRLRNATLTPQPLMDRIPWYRFHGRYKRQYNVSVGVYFGLAHPPVRLRRLADRVLGSVVLPRWVPFTARTSCPVH